MQSQEKKAYNCIYSKENKKELKIKQIKVYNKFGMYLLIIIDNRLPNNILQILNLPSTLNGISFVRIKPLLYLI